VLTKFLRSAQNEFEAKVKKIRSDNGTEFKNTQVEDFLDEDIMHEFWILILLNKMGWPKGRTILSSRWHEPWLMNTRPPIDFGRRRSTRHAMQLTASTSKLIKKISYELLTGNKPNVSYFQVFRSKRYILQKRSKSSKFAPKIYEGFLLGYDSNSHAYRVFNVTTGCVEITCDAMFDETNGS
jgi:hypothetical protein